MRVARNAPRNAAMAHSSPERDPSVVDDDEEVSRRRRREERRALPRCSAGLGVEPLNVVTHERVSSYRTTSATASCNSKSCASLVPDEPGVARLELPPAGSRAESCISPPSHAQRGDLLPGPRSGGPIPWVPAQCSRATALLALHKTGGALIELPPTGSRAGGGTDPPPHVVTSGGCPPRK